MNTALQFTHQYNQLPLERNHQIHTLSEALECIEGGEDNTPQTGSTGCWLPGSKVCKRESNDPILEKVIY